MAPPGLEGEHGVPFRDRAVFAGSHQFADPGATTIVVAPEIVSRLRSAAVRERPRETGGLLSGRVLRDSGGRYVIVSDFVQAAPGTGRPGMFVMSPQATAALRAEAVRRQPTADVVGWWHSHAQPSEYSDADRLTQEMWIAPDCVGLLVFASGTPWAHAYLGPQARRLTALAWPALSRAPRGRSWLRRAIEWWTMVAVGGVTSPDG
jgi:proteasome lid subunit RPN8/RPN11